jgi:hypothetical protein
MTNGNRFYVGIDPNVVPLANAYNKVYEKRRIEDIKKKAFKAYQTGDINKMMEVSVRYPETQQIFEKALNFYDKETKRSYIDSLANLYFDPSLQNAEKIASERQNLLAKKGVPASKTQETDTFLERYKQDPKGTLKAIEGELTFLAPEKMKTLMELRNKSPEKLTDLQSNYEYAKSLGFEGSIIDFNEEMKAKAERKTADIIEYEYKYGKKKTGDKTIEEPEIDKIPEKAEIDKTIEEPEMTFEDFQADKQRREAEARLTPLEKKLQEAQLEDLVSKAEKRKEEKEEALRQKLAAQDQEIFDIDAILATADDTEKILDEAIIPPTGFGTYLDRVPLTSALKLKEYIRTLKAHIGFQKLADIRAASPTGGALGQVSERELMFLQQVIGPLNPAMGEKELRKTFKKIRAYYKNRRKLIAMQSRILKEGMTPEVIKEAQKLTNEIDKDKKVVKSKAEYDALPSGAIFYKNARDEHGIVFKEMRKKP